MNISRLRYHLKVIYNGVVFILRVPILQLFTIIWLLLLIRYNLGRFLTTKIKWDLKFSLKHFLEILCMYMYTFITMVLCVNVLLSAIFVLYKLNNYGRIALIVYCLYIYHHHMTTYSVFDKIGYTTLRNSFLGRYARSFHPVELVKTTELEPNRNYIIASFPHGFMCFGIRTNMLFDIGKWMSLFPRIRPMVATLDINFCLPILRNVLHAFGVISASKDALLHYLCQSNDPSHSDNKDGFTSNAIGLVVGGAQEAIYSTPGVYKLVLKNRKGFIRVAILSGCSIVPSFSFSEVDLFDQIILRRGTFLNRFQNLFKNIFGPWPFLFVGRGVFQETCGTLPRRKALVQVVGAPIDVVQSDKPDPRYVDEIHEKFIEALTALFETHKKKYLDDYENVHLLII